MQTNCQLIDGNCPAVGLVVAQPLPVLRTPPKSKAPLRTTSTLVQARRDLMTDYAYENLVWLILAASGVACIVLSLLI